jgi:hypothetical protein
MHGTPWSRTHSRRRSSCGHGPPNFFRCGVVFRTYTMHLNVQRWCTAGFLPCPPRTELCHQCSSSDTCSGHTQQRSPPHPRTIWVGLWPSTCSWRLPPPSHSNTQRRRFAVSCKALCANDARPQLHNSPQTLSW